MQQGRPWAQYADDIEDALEEFALAKNFKWGLKEIRSLSYEDRMKFLAILGGIGRAVPKEKK